ncbi:MULTISPECIES: hypothetical protein [unclassified Streptomyces]|uniref:hypothetical protein n=1 Tax=unclassified Streptomyces TaxID=2593676 RepID=UPI00339F7BC7
MKRWANEGPNGPHPMTPALQVEIRSELAQARTRMIMGVVLALLGVGVTVWTFVNGEGRIVILGGGLALGCVVFLTGYFWDMRIRGYLSRHGVSMESVKSDR